MDFKKQMDVATIVAMYLLCTLFFALAASGDSMDGSSFSSDSSLDSSLSSSFGSDHYSSGYWESGKLSRGDKIAFFVLGSLGSFAILMICLCCLMPEAHSVLFLQVGLLGTARSLQRNLTQMTPTADSPTRYDFNRILKATTKALLEHPNYCMSASFTVDRIWGSAAVEKHFNQLAQSERNKFDVETLVNINNQKIQRKFVPETERQGKDFIIVSILVAVQGWYKLPAIEDSETLNKALEHLGSISVSNTKAVLVLWTPQNEEDALVAEELLQNYSLLRSIQRQLCQCM